MNGADAVNFSSALKILSGILRDRGEGSPEYNALSWALCEIEHLHYMLDKAEGRR